jgi:hypothetical protein
MKIEIKKDAISVKIHPNFYKKLEKFMKEYEEKNKIKISIREATKLLDLKLEQLGGLVVD